MEEHWLGADAFLGDDQFSSIDSLMPSTYISNQRPPSSANVPIVTPLSHPQTPRCTSGLPCTTKLEPTQYLPVPPPQPDLFGPAPAPPQTLSLLSQPPLPLPPVWDCAQRSRTIADDPQSFEPSPPASLPPPPTRGAIRASGILPTAGDPPSSPLVDWMRPGRAVGELKQGLALTDTMFTPTASSTEKKQLTPRKAASVESRVMRNRASARRSALKKKQHVDRMESRIIFLEKTNRDLEQALLARKLLSYQLTQALQVAKGMESCPIPDIASSATANGTPGLLAPQ